MPKENLKLNLELTEKGKRYLHYWILATCYFLFLLSFVQLLYYVLCFVRNLLHSEQFSQMKKRIRSLIFCRSECVCMGNQFVIVEATVLRLYFGIIIIYTYNLVISLPKSCPYSELFWSVFSRIQTEYGEILWHREVFLPCYF